MIASLAAVGLGPGLSSGGSRSGAPLLDDEETAGAVETPGPEFTFPDGPPPTIDGTKPYKATLVTNKGPIEIELSTDAPEAVNSFAFLAGQGFYNGTIFFYVDKDFVAQAGDPTCAAGGESLCTGVGGPGYTLKVENTAEGHQQWAVVAPAVVEGQSVHGSQFRILLQPDDRLDGKETVFGKVVKGQEILEAQPDFVPCSVAQTEACAASMDAAEELVIEDVIVQPA